MGQGLLSAAGDAPGGDRFLSSTLRQVEQTFAEVRFSIAYVHGITGSLSIACGRISNAASGRCCLNTSLPVR